MPYATKVSKGRLWSGDICFPGGHADEGPQLAAKTQRAEDLGMT